MRRVKQAYRPDLVGDAKSWEGTVLEAQAVSTSEIVHEGRTEQKTMEVARNAFEWLDRLTADFHADCTPRLACREGCSYCCSVPVDVSPPEVFAIVELLEAVKSRDDLDALRQVVGWGSRFSRCGRGKEFVSDQNDENSKTFRSLEGRKFAA